MIEFKMLCTDHDKPTGSAINMCNVIKLLMHVSSTAAVYKSALAVLYEEEN